MAVILIVDDSAYSRQVIRRALKDEHHTLLEAANGLEALEILETRHVDLVTIDLLMPDMRGEDLLDTIKKTRPEIRCLVLTADVQDLTRQEMLSRQADAFVNKPVQAEVLVKNIRQLLES